MAEGKLSVEEIADIARYPSGTSSGNILALCAMARRSLVMEEAARDALKLLEQGAPGWGVSKDALRAALTPAQSDAEGEVG